MSEDQGIIMRVEESTKHIMEEIAGLISEDIISSILGIEGRLSETLVEIESKVQRIDRNNNERNLEPSCHFNQEGIVTGITSAKTAILDLISRNALSDKSTIEALPGAVASLRGLIEKEVEKYAAFLSEESEKMQSLQAQSSRIVEKAETIESRVGDPITRIEALLTDVKKSTDDLVAPTEDPDKKQAVVSDVTSAKTAILDLISRNALSDKSSIESLPGAVASLRGLIEKEVEKYAAFLSEESEKMQSLQAQSSRIVEKAETIESRVGDPITRIETLLTEVKVELNGIFERLSEQNTKVDSILDCAHGIVDYEQTMIPKLERRLDELFERQKESEKTQLQILYKMTPFWKNKERKSIKERLLCFSSKQSDL